MKAKYFAKLRAQCKYYKVEAKDDWRDWYFNPSKEKTVLARSESESVLRYSKRTGSFLNNIWGKPTESSPIFANYRVTHGQRVTYWR